MDTQSRTQSQPQSNTTNSEPEPKKNILLGYIFEFIKQNILWVIVTIVILFITNPLEISIGLSYCTKLSLGFPSSIFFILFK